jgi:hypothetical protein
MHSVLSILNLLLDNLRMDFVGLSKYISVKYFFLCILILISLHYMSLVWYFKVFQEHQGREASGEYVLGLLSVYFVGEFRVFIRVEAIISDGKFGEKKSVFLIKVI